MLKKCDKKYFSGINQSRFRDKIFKEKIIPRLTSPVRDGILMDKFNIEYDSRYLLKDIQ